MKAVLVVALCFVAAVYCQTQNKNGNPTGEIGQPAFDEIVVESTLTVRGKSGSRSGKSLITNGKPPIEALVSNRRKPLVTQPRFSEAAVVPEKPGRVNGSRSVLIRSRRESVQSALLSKLNFNKHF